MFYGFKILYDNEPLIELIFRKDFDKFQLKNMIEDIYAILHTTYKYTFFFLNEFDVWQEVSKYAVLEFVDGEDEIGFK